MQQHCLFFRHTSESLESDIKHVDPISVKLTEIVKRHNFDDKPKYILKEISIKYSLPSNLNELIPSKVNPIVWRSSTPATRELNLKMQIIEKSLVKGLIPLTLLSNRILSLSSVMTNYSI